MENPIKAIVLLLEDGRVLNVKLESIKGVSLTQGAQTYATIEFYIENFEIFRNLEVSHRTLGKPDSDTLEAE